VAVGEHTPALHVMFCVGAFEIVMFAAAGAAMKQHPDTAETNENRMATPRTTSVIVSAVR
jgi:hypothetical protein